MSRTYGSKNPIELAFGKRHPDDVSLENSDPGQLTTEPLSPDEIINKVRTEALNSYFKSRQHMDLRRDLASSLRFLNGPFTASEQV